LRPSSAACRKWLLPLALVFGTVEGQGRTRVAAVWSLQLTPGGSSTVEQSPAAAWTAPRSYGTVVRCTWRQLKKRNEAHRLASFAALHFTVQPIASITRCARSQYKENLLHQHRRQRSWPSKHTRGLVMGTGRSATPRRAPCREVPMVALARKGLSRGADREHLDLAAAPGRNGPVLRNRCSRPAGAGL